MEGKFDEALVERLAKAMYEAQSHFILSLYPHSISMKGWEILSSESHQQYCAQACAFLSSLSETHAIVPKEEYAKIIDTLKNVRSDLIERICNRCDHNCSGCEEVYPHRARIEEILAKEAYCLRWKV